MLTPPLAGWNDDTAGPTPRTAVEPFAAAGVTGLPGAGRSRASYRPRPRAAGYPTAPGPEERCHDAQ